MFSIQCTVFCDTATIFFFFFNDTATTEIYTLSLHDALPILLTSSPTDAPARHQTLRATIDWSYQLLSPAEQRHFRRLGVRSEEHTSELQSRQYLVCRLLLEKKKIQLIRLYSSAITLVY